MPEEPPKSTSEFAKTAVGTIRLRRWFALGFLGLFVGQLFWGTALIPFARGAALVPLWRYYQHELGRGWTRNLGLEADLCSVILTEHILISAAGGLAGMGIIALARKLKRSEAPRTSGIR